MAIIFLDDEKQKTQDVARDIELEQRKQIKELNTNIQQEKQQIASLQAENRFNKLKQQTNQIPIKELEKMNVGGKYNRLIVERKAEEKAQDKISDILAEQKVAQFTGLRPVEQQAIEKTQKNVAEKMSKEQVDSLEDNQASKFVFLDEEPTVEEKEDEKIDLFEMAGGKITPEMEKDYPYLTAIAKTGREAVSIPAAFFNEMLMNYPKAVLNKMGIEYPTAQTKAGKAGEVVLGVVGGFKNPLLKALGIGKKALGVKEAVGKGAVLGALYSPEDVTSIKERIKAGTFGAAFAGLSEGALKGIKALPKLRDVTAARFVNSLIKPLKKDFAYGKNAGLGVAREKIKANTMKELITKISDKKKQIGEKLNNLYSKSKKTLNLTDIAEPMDKELVELKKYPNVNKAIISRLEDVKDDILNNIKENSSKIPILKAAKLKSEIGNLTKWTGNVSDDEIVNKSLKKVYGKILNKVNNALPQTKSLNERYANMISAENATKYRDVINQRQNLIGFGTRMAGLGGVIVGSVTTASPAPILLGLGAGVLDKAMSTPAVKTRLASWLATTSKEEVKKSLINNPVIRQSFSRLYDKSSTGFGGRIIKIIKEMEKEE